MGFWLVVILFIAGGEGEPPAGTRAVAAEGGRSTAGASARPSVYRNRLPVNPR